MVDPIFGGPARIPNMKSMTGYGTGKSQSALSQIEVSVRSVNGRFLETRFHLPREFVGLESDLKKVIAKHFDRGTLDIFVSRKIKAKLSGVEIDSARISQEVVIQLEKSDINEEISRLKEHTKNYRHLLSEAGAQGKKLDFYTQELLREVNTIGSKSSVSKLTQIVVQAKTLIERLREQIQNVE